MTDYQTNPTKDRLDKMDPIRRLASERAMEMGITSKALSEAAGMEGTYFSGWATKGTPRRLPEHVREAWEKALELPAGALRQPNGSALLRPEPARRPGSMVMYADLAGIPVYNDRGPMNDDTMVDRTPGPNALGGAEVTWGVRISAETGRLRAGDRAFVRPGPPPWPGDTVIAVRDDQIEAVGELAGVTKENLTLIGAGKARISVPRAGTQCWKVAVILCE